MIGKPCSLLPVLSGDWCSQPSTYSDRICVVYNPCTRNINFELLAEQVFDCTGALSCTLKSLWEKELSR